MPETPKQYGARRFRVKIERAKCAIMEAQEELNAYRGNPAEFQALTDAALRRLDHAWVGAFAIERAEQDKVDA